MAKAWCKVSAHLDSHPKIRKAGNLGRQVFEFVLRRNAELDRGGRIPVEHLDPEYLANVLMLTAEQARDGVSRNVTAGLLVRDDPDFVISGWDDEWAKKPLTEAERKRNQRSREREHSTVTKCHDANVTCHACHGSDQIRSEEIRSDPPIVPQGGLGLSDSPDLKPARKRTRPAVDATPAELASVREILDRLSKVAGVAYRGCHSHTRLIVHQLRDGITEHELRAVVAYCADEWERKPDMRKYLRPETLFGPQTIHKYLDAARSRYAREIAEAAATQPKLEVVR